MLDRSLEECRWVYNETLASRKFLWDHAGENIGHFDCVVMLPMWKRARPSLASVFSQCLQNAQKRVDLAFQAFFRRVKAGEKPGYPRFRAMDRYDSVTYPQFGNGVHLEGNTLILSKIGSVAINLHRPVEGECKTVTLRRTATGKWFVSFSCDIGIPDVDAGRELMGEAIPDEAIVGIDLGLTHFAYLSNGEKVANPRFFKDSQKALARAQRRLNECPKDISWNDAPCLSARDRADKKERKRRLLARAHIHERTANRRDDFAHKESRKLVEKYEVICFEDLNIKGMIEDKERSKSICDVAWNKLVSCTTYKAEWAGRRTVLVDPRGTSQRCHKCGVVTFKTLHVRVHRCSNPECGIVLPRDHNSALEIKRLGLQSLAVAEERQQQLVAAAAPKALLPRSRAALAAAE